METHCSLKVFNFRLVNVPGILSLDQTNLTLSFKEKGYGTEFSYVFEINKTTKKEFKNGMLKDSLKIFYENEWYQFTDFTDEKYHDINKAIDELLTKAGD